jgi:hypothetical protein
MKREADAGIPINLKNPTKRSRGNQSIRKVC